MYEMESYTVAVIGAGHAGVEAALSCAVKWARQPMLASCKAVC